MTELNLPLLRKVLEHVEAHPERWNQRAWTMETGCGTACCVAGWALYFSDHNLVRIDDAPQSIYGAKYVLDGEPLDFVDDDRPISEAAAQELGLSKIEATTLFNPHNTLPEIREMCERFAMDAGEKL